LLDLSMQQLQAGSKCRYRSCTRAQRRAAAVRAAVGHDAPIAKVAKLVNGKVTEGPDLSVTVNGMRLPNPFIIGSGPPGTNYQVLAAAGPGRAGLCRRAAVPPQAPSAQRRQPAAAGHEEGL
jgi:hypothetical protein